MTRVTKRHFTFAQSPHLKSFIWGRGTSSVSTCCITNRLRCIYLLERLEGLQKLICLQWTTAADDKTWLLQVTNRWQHIYETSFCYLNYLINWQKLYFHVKKKLTDSFMWMTMASCSILQLLVLSSPPRILAFLTFCSRNCR